MFTVYRFLRSVGAQASKLGVQFTVILITQAEAAIMQYPLDLEVFPYCKFKLIDEDLLESLWGFCCKIKKII